LLRRALGTDRTLRLLLGVERTSWRLAFEAAGRRYGEAFYNESPPLTPDVLRAWVPAGSRVLDLGCGSGRLGRLLAQRVDSYVGIDLNEASIRIAQSLAHPPHVRFAIGDATQPPAEQFDVVILVHVLEHIDGPEGLLRTVARLAPTLIIEVPDFDHCVLNPVRLDLGVDFASDDDHVREYTRVVLRDQLEATGWRVSAWKHGPTSLAALAVTAPSASG
jgi:SAM-dependent methyltransferase